MNFKVFLESKLKDYWFQFQLIPELHFISKPSDKLDKLKLKEFAICLMEFLINFSRTQFKLIPSSLSKKFESENGVKLSVKECLKLISSLNIIVIARIYLNSHNF